MARLLALFAAVATILPGVPARAKDRTPAPCPQPPVNVRLQVAGPGWRIPETWAQRGNCWGTRELVALIQRTGRRIGRHVPGAAVHVADLSPRGGGASPWHRTHRHGLDVDLLVYALDAQGRPAAPGKAMIPFDCDGLGPKVDGEPQLRFDVARTWALVRSVVEDHQAKIEDILVANCLRKKLLAHARAIHAPRAIIAKAEHLMRQPRVAPHNDHIHVRIASPADQCLAGTTRR